MPSRATAIAVNSSGIFWNNTGSRFHRQGQPRRQLASDRHPGADRLHDAFVRNRQSTRTSSIDWMSALGQSVGRATVNGAEPPDELHRTAQRAPAALAVDANFHLVGIEPAQGNRRATGGWWARQTTTSSRVAVTAANDVCGVAVNSQYVFWGNSGASDFIGRSNLSGASSNPSLILGPTDPCLPAAAPANKITVNSVDEERRRRAPPPSPPEVPGPGKVTLNQSQYDPPMSMQSRPPSSGRSWTITSGRHPSSWP